MKKNKEFRAAARVDEQTKKTIAELADKYSMTESEVIRRGLKILFPLWLKGKIDPFKQAA